MQIDRNFFGVYIKDSNLTGKAVLNGTSIEHTYPIGTFVDEDGTVKRLCYVQLSKNMLNDDLAQYKESCDFNLTTLDSDQILPIVKAIFDDDQKLFMEELGKCKSILVKPIILKDLSEGKTLEEILESRIVLFLDQFMGFFLKDVFLSFPFIEEQSRMKDENGEFLTYSINAPYTKNGETFEKEEIVFQYSLQPCKPLEDL